MNQFTEYFEILTEGLDASGSRAPTDRPFQRTWSYGDVENNGVYYHPQLTHYAHQAFEEFFFSEHRLHYVDLSRSTEASRKARDEHKPPIPRMTLPVVWLHQWMLRPMEAGDVFRIGVDVIKVSSGLMGARAWVFEASPKIVADDSSRLAAVVMWLRAAVELDGGDRKPVPIPDWIWRTHGEGEHADSERTPW